MNGLYEIGCKTCRSLDCRGCNMLILHKALENGYFDPYMNGNKQIQLESLEALKKENKDFEKAVRELTRKVKRRDNKIIELEKEIKRLRKLEDTDISIIRACLPELFLGKKIVIARKPKSPKKEPEVIQIYMDEFVGEKED